MIPVIDLSRLRQDPRDPHLVTALDLALRENGMCYLTVHGIAPHLIARAQSAALLFFARPSEYKKKFSRQDGERHLGYLPAQHMLETPSGAMQHIYESYDISLESNGPVYHFAGGKLDGSRNTWPGIIGFRAAVYSYYEAAYGLSQLLTQTIEAALGLSPNTLLDLMQRPQAQLRLMHYPQQQEARLFSNLKRSAQTDAEFFTLLHQTSAGLQTQNAQGKWLHAPPVPNTLLLQLGDMAEAISGGHYRANRYRIADTNGRRFAMPFFSTFDSDALVRPVLDGVADLRAA